MKVLLLVALLCVLSGAHSKFANLAQLQAVQALSNSPYPWGEWVKFKAAMNGVDLAMAPGYGYSDDDAEASPVVADDDDDDLDSEQDPEVIEFLKRAAVEAADDAAGAKKAKKTKAKAKKAPKLKPWEAAVAAKKAAASTTTTPAPTTDFSISYSELVKAILAAHEEETGKAPADPASPTTTTEIPFDPENINYDQLAEAILGVEKKRQEAAAAAE